MTIFPRVSLKPLTSSAYTICTFISNVSISPVRRIPVMSWVGQSAKTRTWKYVSGHSFVRGLAGWGGEACRELGLEKLNSGKQHS